MPCPSDSSGPPANARSGIWLWLALVILLGLAFAADGLALSAMRQFHASPGAEMIRQTVRWLGTGYVQVPLALIMILAGHLWSKRAKQAGGWALLAFAASGLAANALKVIVRRPRPLATDAVPANWYGYLHNGAFHSFPSAETATTFAVALTVANWYPSLRAPLVAVAAVIGVARVLVGSHHPSDVVAGAMLGICVAQSLGRYERRRRAGAGGE